MLVGRIHPCHGSYRGCGSVVVLPMQKAVTALVKRACSHIARSVTQANLVSCICTCVTGKKQDARIRPRINKIRKSKDGVNKENKTVAGGAIPGHGTCKQKHHPPGERKKSDVDVVY